MISDSKVKVSCFTCGKEIIKYKCHVKRVKNNFCSCHCNGIARGKEWAKHGYKGNGKRSLASVERLRLRMTGDKNPSWKGGVTYRNRHGNYANQRIKYVKCPQQFSSMARKDGYVMEHRLLVAQIIGRPLTRKESVHHINHNAEDNRPENLMLFKTNKDHKLYEHYGKPFPVWKPDK